VLCASHCSANRRSRRRRFSTINRFSGGPKVRVAPGLDLD
jgi:hypothetical protein